MYVLTNACFTVDNTATITETGQAKDAHSRVCSNDAGGLTMGFWQNKNGQGIITGGTALISLLVLFIFGGEGVASFSYAMLIGTIVVASGTSIATQIAAVVAFVLVMLGIVELALVGYVISPQKTQAVLQPLHDWSAAHRKQILIALLVVVGIWLTVKGFGIA